MEEKSPDPSRPCWQLQETLQPLGPFSLSRYLLQFPQFGESAKHLMAQFVPEGPPSRLCSSRTLCPGGGGVGICVLGDLCVLGWEDSVLWGQPLCGLVLHGGPSMDADSQMEAEAPPWSLVGKF